MRRLRLEVTEPLQEETRSGVTVNTASRLQVKNKKVESLAEPIAQFIIFSLNVVMTLGCFCSFFSALLLRTPDL